MILMIQCGCWLANHLQERAKRVCDVSQAVISARNKGLSYFNIALRWSLPPIHCTTFCTLLYPFVTSTFYTCSCAGVDEVILREQRDAILLLQRIPTAMPSRLSNAACIHLTPSYDSCVEFAKIATYHFQMWGVLHTSSLKLLRQELFLALEPLFGISNIQSTTKDQFSNWANSLYHESIFLPFLLQRFDGLCCN